MPLTDGKRSGRHQRRVLAQLAFGPKLLKELAAGHDAKKTREALVKLERRGLVNASRTPGRASLWSLPEEEET